MLFPKYIEPVVKGESKSFNLIYVCMCCITIKAYTLVAVSIYSYVNPSQQISEACYQGNLVREYANYDIFCHQIFIYGNCGC